MKTLFVSLVVFLFAFIIGCQESSVTDPLSNNTEMNSSTEELNIASKNVVPFWPDYPKKINLLGVMHDPVHVFGYTKIKGVVKYDLQIITSPDPAYKKAVKIRMSINGLIIHRCPMGAEPWNVSGTSEDIWYLGADRPSTLQKSFTILNPCCAPVRILLTFNVNEKYLTLKSMYLMKCKQNVVSGNSDS